MDLGQATLLAEGWSGGRGLVPRGPRWLLGYRPAAAEEAERHTGTRPGRRETVWRVDVGGRFLRTGGLVYPGGVPFPEELQRQTAVVSSEAWLYVDDETHRVLGVYSWPEAVRRPIASVPRSDFDPDGVVAVEEATPGLGFDLRLPTLRDRSPALVVEWSRDHVVVFLPGDTVPDPLNEMLLFEEEGLSLRARRGGGRADIEAVLRSFQPPFRSLRVGSAPAAGREPGKSLGPQTWPWPAELLWWADGVSYELKGFAGLNALADAAKTMESVVT